jgi:hypothetical protein
MRQARLDPAQRFGVAVTHPFGVDASTREVYRQAAAAFLAGLRGHPQTDFHDVKLVPEAMAAAKFGIEDYFSRRDPTETTFVTLDIGAGTYDVSIIRTGSRDASAWTVASHFGVAVGGSRLDEALISRITDVLDRAARQRDATAAFDIRIDETRDDGDARHWLITEFLAGKIALTATLLKAAEKDYRWPSRTEGGPALNILVGHRGGHPAGIPGKGPVSAKAETDVAVEIVGANAALASEDGRILLRMWRDAFEPEPDDDLETLMEVMGRELPSMALHESFKLGADAAVVVTGRAALWPLLYEAIVQAIQGHQVGKAYMARSKPFDPEQMKQAVVSGAIHVAREMQGRELDMDVENPIALIFFSLGIEAPGRLGARRVPHKVIVVDDGALQAATPPADVRQVPIDGSFLIARIIPGLDRAEGMRERLRLFYRLYQIANVKPFIELTYEIQAPRPGSHTPGAEWRVGRRRALIGTFLTFSSESSEPIEYGPFGAGRIYGGE